MRVYIYLFKEMINIEIKSNQMIWNQLNQSIILLVDKFTQKQSVIQN